MKKRPSPEQESPLRKIHQWMFYLFPAVMFFSYFPVISLGYDDSMNLELSLPLIWLVAFDLLGARIYWRQIWQLRHNWHYILFPIFASLSILWSDNILRGILTAGVIWAITLAIIIIVATKDAMGEKSRRTFFRIFMAATIIVSLWCLVQCILDLAGTPREYSLMCAGCTYRSFGFPHPNGFAIEPQFMGNLLLAPSLLMAWLVATRNAPTHRHAKFALLFFVPVFTLFMTFSRGAIYAFTVAMLFLTALVLVKNWSSRAKFLKRLLAMWAVVIFAFGAGLCTQGLMAALGPTSETFSSGAAKSLNHLTLGIIDLRPKADQSSPGEPLDESASPAKTSASDSASAPLHASAEQAIFDGYVAESTEVRKEMTRNALAIWRRAPGTILFGVGLGGAGQAMCEAGLTGSPKEIVQNQYISILAELGLVGGALALVTLVLIIKRLVHDQSAAVLTLLVAYGISLVFFAGLPNALQVYLIPAIIWGITSPSKRSSQLVRRDA